MSKLNQPPAVSQYELARVAQGYAEADLAVLDGKVVNVYTAEVLEGVSILIKGDRIAYVGQDPQRGIGPRTRIIDAGGRAVIPGLIDGHAHIDYIFCIHELTRYAMKSGTTSIISETAQLSTGLGYRGVLEFIKSTRNQPVKFWITIPPQVTISPIFRQHLLTLDEVRRLLKRKEIVGLGEVYWGPAIAGDKPGLDMISATLEAGKKIEGHSAGASAHKLQAYTSLGVTSDHEPITAEEALERLRLGLSVMIREGEVRCDLEAVSRIKDRDIDFRRLSISTDGIGPCELIDRGFMEHLVQKAINLGIPPVRAVQMATLNVAEHFNLGDYIGGIAPGRFADIVIIPDLEHIRPEVVISNGRIVMQNGELTVSPRRHVYPRYTYQSIRLRREVSPDDFTIRTGTASPAVKVRVIDQITNLLTREAILEMPVKDGQIPVDVSRGIIKAAAVERMQAPNTTFTGFIRGTGLREGAIATSTSWDSADIMVIGASETDMALAVNRIKELGGGLTVALNGAVAEELAFPVGGMLSTAPMETLAEKLARIQNLSREMGCTSPDIRTTISILCTGAIPYLRICESGLFNLRTNSMVSLIVEE